MAYRSGDAANSDRAFQLQYPSSRRPPESNETTASRSTPHHQPEGLARGTRDACLPGSDLHAIASIQRRLQAPGWHCSTLTLSASVYLTAYSGLYGAHHGRNHCVIVRAFDRRHNQRIWRHLFEICHCTPIFGRELPQAGVFLSHRQNPHWYASIYDLAEGSNAWRQAQGTCCAAVIELEPGISRFVRLGDGHRRQSLQVMTRSNIIRISIPGPSGLSRAWAAGFPVRVGLVGGIRAPSLFAG